MVALFTLLTLMRQSASAQEADSTPTTPAPLPTSATDKPTATSVARQASTPTTPEGLARSGELIWGEREAIQGLRDQQLWMHWEHTDPPPVETLEDMMVRRRAIIEAIERELLVREAKRRGISLSLEELKRWVYEQIPGEDRPTFEGLDNLVRARLKLKAGASLGAFWRASERVALVERLRAELTAELTDEAGREEWLKRGRLIGLSMLLVPRVPTSDEITQAIRKFQPEMRAYFKKHKALFSQADRALVTPIFFSEGKGERERQQLVELRRMLSEGRSLSDLKAQYPTLQTRAKQSLSARLLPKKTTLVEGGVSRPRITRYGWTIYLIHSVYRGYTRSFEERSVQRECASAVLIEGDLLTHAKRSAERGRQLLQSGDEASVRSWAKANRAHLKLPAPFYANPNQIIPMLGTAPALHDQLFSFKVGEVSEVTPVRQSYVIAKVTSRQEQTADWEATRVEFMRSWRAERARKILNEWLSARLEGQPRWVSSSRLKALALDPLRAPLSVSLSDDAGLNSP